VPLGEDLPYVIDGTTIYLRQEAETNIAMRDEIVLSSSGVRCPSRPPFVTQRLTQPAKRRTGWTRREPVCRS